MQRPIYINTNLIGGDEIKKIDDLLDPRWKGKIVTSEVTQGYVYTPSTLIRDLKGEDFLRKLFVDQQPIMIRDRRQAVEALVRYFTEMGEAMRELAMRNITKPVIVRAEISPSDMAPDRSPLPAVVRACPMLRMPKLSPSLPSSSRGWRESARR